MHKIEIENVNNLDDNDIAVLEKNPSRKKLESSAKENFKKTPESEAEIIAKFDISPEQRRDLNTFINNLRSSDTRWRYTAAGAKKFPVEVRHSKFIQELVKNRFLEEASTHKNFYDLGDWTDLIDDFGIKEDFFKQDKFIPVRQRLWLERLGCGEAINSADRLNKDSWGYAEDNLEEFNKKKKEEELKYGPLEKVGLDLKSNMVRGEALKGLANKIVFESDWQVGETEDLKEDLKKEYKKYFNLTDSEIAGSLIEKLRKEYVFDIKKDERLRHAYPEIDTWLKSDEVKLIIKSKLRRDKINGSSDNPEFLKYFDISEADFDYVEIEAQRKISILESLKERNSKGNIDFLWYDLERATKVFNQADWQNLFKQSDLEEILIDGIAGGLVNTWQLAETKALLNKIEVPEEMLKKGAIKALANISGHREKFSIADMENLKSVLGLSEADYQEGFTLGTIRILNRGASKFDIDNRQEQAKITELSDSPSIQKEVKKIYLEAVAKGESENLKLINDKFNPKWEKTDRPLKNEALKKALIDGYSLSKFKSLKQLAGFIDESAGERHNVFLISDPEIKLAVEKMLIDSPFYRNLNKDQHYYQDLIKYFSLSEEGVFKAIGEKIKQGKFVSNHESKNNFQKYLPEFDLVDANKKCLVTNGLKLIENALENKNWDLIKEMQKYEDQGVNEKIELIIIEQEKNLKDESKSSKTRSYAIEALANLSQGLDYLEDNYFKELTKIYSETDLKKLLDLFKRKSEKFNALDNTERSDIFDKFLTSVETSGNIGDEDPRAEILKKDALLLLSPEQSARTFQSSNFTVASTGLIEAIKNKSVIPDHIFANFHKRLSENINSSDNSNSNISMPAEFETNLITFLKIGASNEKLISLMTNKSILKEIAAHPEEITEIENIMNKVPSSLLLSDWEFIYSEFKGISVEDFDAKNILIQQLSPLRNSWVLSGSSLGDSFKCLESYTPEQRKDFFEIVKLNNDKVSAIEFDEKNWAPAIISYVSATEDENRLNLTSINKNKVIEKFSGSYRDIALTGFQNDWATALNNKKDYFLPPNLLAVAKSIDDAGGAGNLKYIESLGNLIHQYDSVLSNNKIPTRTKVEIQALLKRQEDKVKQEKWSQDDRAEFYNLSTDVIEAAPSLYSAYSPLLEQLSPKEMKVFLSENFPLYQAQLVTVQESNSDKEGAVYKPRNLVIVRQGIEELTNKLKDNPTEKNQLLKAEKERLIEVIKESFKDRFGIAQVPAEFSKENLRSVQNGVRYMGNISKRNATTEAIIALYLGLELNNDWEEFRQGKDLKPEDYLVGKQLEKIKPILDARAKSYARPLEVAGISPEKAIKFQEILQEEGLSNMIGNIQTVDIRLANIKTNISELADPDIYTNDNDKKIMSLLLSEGRSVGSVLAKTYASLSGKSIEFSDQEKLIQTRLEIIYGINNWSKGQVELIQNQIQPFSLVVNMTKRMEEEKVDENISELQKRLKPTDKAIAIFNRLGEDFKVESGAVALAKDVSYLESLLIKDDNKLSVEEKTEVKEYLASIKEKITELEGTLGRIKEYFSKLNKSSHLANQPLLQSRLDEVKKIVNSEGDSGVITSHLTKDLNLVIENMRQCLGCRRKEDNNDTNLAFGDFNKFFMMSQSEKEKGSVADEIVFFLPVKSENHPEEMSFVMDRVYGKQTPDILLANIQTIFKKYQAIKKEIPEAKISITVSDATLSSVSSSAELIAKRLKELLPEIKFSERITSLVAEIPKSNLSDNYIEFGSLGARGTGGSVFSGLVIH